MWRRPAGSLLVDLRGAPRFAWSADDFGLANAHWCILSCGKVCACDLGITAECIPRDSCPVRLVEQACGENLYLKSRDPLIALSTASFPQLIRVIPPYSLQVSQTPLQPKMSCNMVSLSLIRGCLMAVEFDLIFGSPFSSTGATPAVRTTPAPPADPPREPPGRPSLARGNPVGADYQVHLRPAVRLLSVSRRREDGAASQVDQVDRVVAETSPAIGLVDPILRALGRTV